MTGRKVKLAFIANDCARRASYRRRKKSMLKKIEELSTLCGVGACAIVYSPFDQEPQIWPSESGVQNVVEKFRTMPESKKHKMGNQESVMEKSIMKGKRKITKLKEENKEMEITMFMFQCLDTSRVQSPRNVTLADLNLLSSVIEQKLNDIGRRLDLTDVTTEVPYQPQIQTFVDTNLKL